MPQLVRTLILGGAFVFTAACAESMGEPAGVARLAQEIRDAGLDENACYRVRDLSFLKEDLRFYLTDGYLVFGKPVRDRISSAVFIPPETGDAEVIVMPPTRSERASLAKFADTPNLNEHFTTAVFIFSDDTAKTLLDELKAAGATPSPEKGILIKQEWNDVVRNLTGSVDMRLVQDRLNASGADWGLFYAAVRARERGNIDLIYDPQAHDQITVGKVEFRDNRAYFNVWTSFSARSFRNGRRQSYRSPVTLSDFQINADFEPNLRLRAVTRMHLQTAAPIAGTVPFDLTRQMTASRVLIDGHEVEIYAHESLRSDLLRGNDNGVILVGLDSPLQPGRTYNVEVQHAGKVVTSAGNNVYFVGARTNWYPTHGMSFALYDITFRYPKNLQLIASGDIVEERTEGEWRVTHNRTSAPIRFAGFNLGEFAKVSTERTGYTVDVYANRKAEAALRDQNTEMVILPPPSWRTQRRQDVLTIPAPALPPNPMARLQTLAADCAAALDYMASFLGPPPLKKLTVSPIPAPFGQGFPGLLYLSTLAYLDAHERPPGFRREMQQMFYSEILEAHETAHQWWGNLVTTASYEDDWVMEALANYSALMFLEKRKGRRALDAVLTEYKGHLLLKMPEGGTIESAGPITWGSRLRSSQFPAAWRVITYEKGSWIMHMLRGRIGDDAFLKMLGTVVARYRYKPLSTDEFKKVAMEFMPAGAIDRSLDAFFEQWVYGTGIPAVSLSHSVRGKAPVVSVRATVSQSSVDDDFTAIVPIEVQLPGKRSITEWVRTADEPVTVTIAVKLQPLKIVLDPNNVILRK